MANYDVVGVCGYGNSGASAILDLLSDSKDLQVYTNTESQILHQVDGILDLKHYLVDCRDKIASNTALKRYRRSLYDCRYRAIEKSIRKQYRAISEDYLRKLILCSWMGSSGYDAADVIGIEKYQLGTWFYRGIVEIFKLFHVDVMLPKSRERYFSLMSEHEFIEVTSQYFDSFFSLYGFTTEKPLVMEQFFVFSNPTAGNEFFKSSKIILVERDPRDVYASSKYGSKAGASKRILRFMPVQSVEQFVRYYRGLHTGLEMGNNVLTVNFEDLIYDYKNTKDKISQFLNIDMNFGGNFHPEISINNTKFYKKCDGIQKDIDYICDELPQFLNHYVD